MQAKVNDVNKWTKETSMDKTAGNKIPPSYPNEAMVKIFASNYFSNNFSPIEVGQKVVDVGCGYGNNLRFFMDRGCTGFGVDVTSDMVELAQSNLKRLGYDAHIALGKSDKIPFSDNEFDIVISVNAIHYQVGADGIDKALNEFKRVTKKGGKIFIMTVGPKHEIRTKGKKHGLFAWEVRDYGFRTGDMLSLFDDEKHLESVLSEKFSSVETGLISENYSVRVLDFYYAICINN